MLHDYKLYRHLVGESNEIVDISHESKYSVRVVACEFNVDDDVIGSNLTATSCYVRAATQFNTGSQCVDRL